MEEFNSTTRADIIRKYGLEKDLQGKRVLDVLKSAPVPLGTVVPQGWVLNEDGIYHLSSNKSKDEPELKLISYEPIVISGTFENLTDGSEGLILSWYNGLEWKEIARSRDYFVASNKIIELAYFGFPVNSNNSKSLIQYITDFCAANRSRIQFKSFSEQLGWLGDGFLLGKQYISQDGKEIIFNPTDVGEKQLVEGIHAKGDIDTWLSIIERISEFPNVMIGVYASLASILSSILKVDCLILEWASETSKGKTISLKVAASVWGNPTTEENGIVRKWNVTPVNIERAESVLKNLPLFLDDTKDLSRTKAISNLVYNIASGQGRGRGSIKGSQKVHYWNNITFSTGEQKITTFTKDGGAAARVMPITALPFGKADNETAQLVDSIEMDIQDSYGVAGEYWVRYVIDNKESWFDWKNMYRMFWKMYSQQAKGNSVIGRLAKYMALITTAAALFNDCFKVEYEYFSILDIVWRQIIEENREVDRPLEAVKAVYEWVVSNQQRFDDGKGFKTNDDYGIWNPSEFWNEILIYPTQLSNYLEKQGYEPTSIIKSWFDRGWLNVTKGRGYKKQKKIKGIQIDFLSIRRDALEQ